MIMKAKKSAIRQFVIHPLIIVLHFKRIFQNKSVFPSKIAWDLTNGPLSKLLELLDTQV